MKRHPSCFSACFWPGLVSLLLFSLGAKADELMKWERIPLSIALKVGQERIIFADRNVRVGFPPSLNHKLRVQSAGGAVYLKASQSFPSTRLQLQDSENGEIILLDITATNMGPTEPVRILYPDEKSSASKEEPRHQRKSAPSAPAPVVLTRYAAQQLYAPLRTVEPVTGIHPVSLHLPVSITTLYPSEPIAVSPLAGWGVQNYAVVALKLCNTVKRNITLDPRALQGKFVSATFQHRWLGEAGTPEDTTVLYLVVKGQPENAFLPEPVAVKPGGCHAG
ncbi:TIGR03749 family integrating conjugative element protein [Xenorhabdus nematophila]|uniref:TIGR03749 family integrating conjugative element protein n=1 Tax=Xenorhabdus nematophila TaxID=628 RepID=UPI00056DEB3B|nr:TIGR03749 family integrating conjugative element protein [Xenorhabdus nematophila]AYA39142.1 TIGR03749 family integrating conjugative element protein [Xenorhabdus nematophila]AYA39211.1 TIGR03749 family integrating conjugative element protein [Xenorhabdus nematophila]KHD27054.1 conjugal transfer protein [Xenorhabdus nematophila]MBA0017728.1 TIGR03749 family integrating conjugative element protein [Xenorhabdus nematophila]MCB4426779.1 TIGR03749 family integrating conjugative element protein 